MEIPGPGTSAWPVARLGRRALALALVAVCARTSSSPAQSRPEAPLREVARVHALRVGSAVGRSFFDPGREGERYRALLAREFDMLTAENDMKFQRLRPSRGEFTLERADSLVAFAERHGMQVRGHTLVWHNQLAPWLTGGTWTREEAIALMREHIETVVGRYRGRLVAWDVVNEAVADDASMRRSFWSEKVGPDYIEMAFHLAHQADPNVALYYNDYGTDRINAKSDSVYNLVRGLVERGVPVHGVGFQMHLTGGRVPTRAEMVANFARFAALGLKIHITELDVRVPQPATAEHLRVQAENYREVFAACLETKACTSVVTWGFTDRDSWIPRTFPGSGSALLFDESFRPKPAYAAVHRLLSGK